MFVLQWASEAEENFKSLKNNVSLEKHYKAVKKAIKYLSEDPRHKSLQTHEYESLKGPKGEKVFEAYAEQNTPVAYRMFWYYGPNRGKITIVAITPHP